ncbi:hypothetical protein D7X25_34735 [bacterium 1XD42-8]|nr:hypothetical protein D7X25_34735 [bacterium 1XD42-8]
MTLGIQETLSALIKKFWKDVSLFFPGFYHKEYKGHRSGRRAALCYDIWAKRYFVLSTKRKEGMQNENV